MADSVCNSTRREFESFLGGQSESGAIAEAKNGLVSMEPNRYTDQNVSPHWIRTPDPAPLAHGESDVSRAVPLASQR